MRNFRRIRRVRNSSALVVMAMGLCACVPAGAAPAEWSQFLGPTRDGRAAVTERLPESEALDLVTLWRRPLGGGYSAVVTEQGRLFTLFAAANAGTLTDVLVALDAADGSEIWRVEIAPGGGDDGPLSTPVVDGGVVYALGPQGDLLAASTDTGKVLWTRNLVRDNGASVPLFGMASSPMVLGDLLLVQVGGKAGTLCGLERKTGMVRWCAGDSRVGYNSPIALRRGVTTQVIAASDTNLMAVEAATGKILWDQVYNTGMEGSSHPIVAGDDHLLIEGRGSVVVYALSAAGVPSSPRRLWGIPASRENYDFPVFHEGHFYGFRNDVLTCAEAATGTSRWSATLPAGGHAILIDGRLAIWTSEGRIVLAEASPEGYQEIASAQVLDQGGYTAPSFAGGVLYVRNGVEVAAVQVVAAAPESLQPTVESAGE